MKFRWIQTGFIGMAAVAAASGTAAQENDRPNILLCLADDWSAMNAGCYGDPQVRTPNIDALAAKGIRFEHAYCSSPSCSPARAAILTGRMAIELEEAANLFGGFQNKFQVYPALLEDAGYTVGFERKGWAPGNWQGYGWKHNPAGQEYSDFATFLKNRPKDRPFCFWFGSRDPHLPYVDGYAESCGFMPDQLTVPPYLMNTPGVRKTFAGYLAAVARFDREVGERIKLLEAAGELDNTLIVVTSDNGMPFPGAKTRLEDRGTRMPMVIYWKNGAVNGGRVVNDFVSTPELAPTFLEAAGVPVPDEMTARSLMPLLTSSKSGQIDSSRDFIVTCRERHCPAQPDSWGGYPMRAIRTADFLYIRNDEPERWPQGNWPSFIDVDDSHCKNDYVKNWQNPEYKNFMALLQKKPAELLFDLRTDPDELKSVAGEAEYAGVQKELSAKMTAWLQSINDPRMAGDGWKFDTYEWFTGWKHPQFGGNWKECGQKGLEH
jgi:arylsulfatase A-like enzyme